MRVRTLRKKIAGMLYERTALSKKPDKLAARELKSLREEDKLTPDLVFRDPYLLDFLGYLDLLFFHRRPRRLVAIDLKLGKFEPSDIGQIEFYLRWLKKHEMRPGEEDPLGLILCAEKSDERVELLELETRGIRIAEYLTALPPKKVLKQKLHQAVLSARTRLQAAKSRK